MDFNETAYLRKVTDDRFGDVASSYFKILELLREEGKISHGDGWKTFIPQWKDVELFDFSAVAPAANARPGLFEIEYTNESGYYIGDFDRYEYILDMPFSSCFIKMGGCDYIFLREEKVGFYAGTYVMMVEVLQNSAYALIPISFSIASWTAADSEDMSEATTFFMVDPACLSFKGLDVTSILSDLSSILLKVQDIFANMNKFCYARSEDFAFKKRIIKCGKSNKVLLKPRPMYIVLGENTRTVKDRVQREFPNYKFMHSFPVRGHWRRLQDSRKYGKDRQGNYNQLGFTWVKECVKGSGELVKRPHIVLSEGENNGN